MLLFFSNIIKNLVYKIKLIILKKKKNKKKIFKMNKNFCFFWYCGDDSNGYGYSWLEL